MKPFLLYFIYRNFSHEKLLDVHDVIFPNKLSSTTFAEIQCKKSLIYGCAIVEVRVISADELRTQALLISILAKNFEPLQFWWNFCSKRRKNINGDIMKNV